MTIALSALAAAALLPAAAATDRSEPHAALAGEDAPSVIVVVPSPPGGQAQPARPDKRDTSPLPAPSGRTDSLLNGFSTDLEINNDKRAVTLSLGKRFKPQLSAGGADGMTARFGQTSLSASVSVPVAGKDDLTDPQTLNKLSNGPSLTVALSYFTTSGRDGETRYEPGAGWQFGAKGTIGTNTFDYRVPVTLAERDESRTQFSVGGFIAHYPTDMRSMISLGATFESAHEAPDETILCKPVVTVPADDCVKAVPGAPVKDESLPLSLEYRRTFDIGWKFADLAISPTVTYDALDDEYGLDLPIYLLPLGKAPILPGIKIGYSSEEDEVSFGVFLKASFGLAH